MSSSEFLFILDLSGYSALTDVHGARTAANTVSRLMKIVNDSVLPDVFLEERIGDELILSSLKGESLLTACFEIKLKLEREHNFLSFHAALHYGEIFRQAGGLFSTTVNLTARLTSMAKSNQILCSKAFLENTTLSDRYSVQPLGEFKFKNILNKIPVYAITDKKSSNDEKVIDPVCKMTIHLDDKTLKLELKGKPYYFCSQRCMSFFENHPDQFIMQD